MQKKLAFTKELVTKWLECQFLYHFTIDNIEIIKDIGIKVSFSESTPMGEWSSNYFIVKDGRINNSNGDDVVDLALDASDDIDFKAQIKDFVNKYYC